MTTVKIPLSQGLFALIDEEDFPRVMEAGKKWFAHQSRKRFYAETKIGQDQVIKLHRLIVRAKPGDIVDHINRDGLDNRKCNLRITDHNGNAENKDIYSNNKSGVAGVYFARTTRGRKFWHAQITRNGKQRLIGRYLTKEEAIAARLEAENV